MWKKTAMRWPNWSKSSFKFKKFRMRRYLQHSIIWEDIEVQTIPLHYKEIGTDMSMIRNKKLAAMTTSLNFGLFSNKMDSGKTESSAYNFKTPFKHINLGPSRFPFICNSKIESLPLPKMERASKSMPKYNTYSSRLKKIEDVDIKQNKCNENNMKTTVMQLPNKDTVDLLTQEIWKKSTVHSSTTDLDTHRISTNVSRNADTQIFIVQNNAETEMKIASISKSVSNADKCNSAIIAICRPRGVNTDRTEIKNSQAESVPERVNLTCTDTKLVSISSAKMVPVCVAVSREIGVTTDNYSVSNTDLSLSPINVSKPKTVEQTQNTGAILNCTSTTTNTNIIKKQSIGFSTSNTPTRSFNIKRSKIDVGIQYSRFQEFTESKSVELQTRPMVKSTSVLTSLRSIGETQYKDQVVMCDISDHVCTRIGRDIETNTHSHYFPSELDDDQPISMSHTTGVNKSSANIDHNYQTINNHLVTYVNAEKWIKRCTGNDDYQSLLYNKHSTLKALEHNLLSGNNSIKSNKYAKRSLKTDSLKSTKRSLPKPDALPSTLSILSTDSLADVFPSKVYEKTGIIVTNPKPIIVDKVTSDDKPVRNVKESLLQTYPDVRHAAIESKVNYQKSASVLTSRYLLPFPKTCRKINTDNKSMDCIFIYDRPRCLVYEQRLDPSVQKYSRHDNACKALYEDANLIVKDPKQRRIWDTGKGFYISDIVTRHLAPSIQLCLYHLPTFSNITCMEASTMKPSGRELGCQTYRKRIHRPLYCCALTPSVTSIPGNHDKNHLNSIYCMLTAIEGRIRRLKLNITN
ncbi:uncharacterized protein LOC116413578 [Galleria mellonella]|uniref:Uncharacterized protein LOC116413578 n=1 Tax=Galleria mellonella TaxID=7137 RepID=A0A6J3CE82_GALME|nr:uncharacterized protein LOC116413578 [Galleria mellonella]